MGRVDIPLIDQRPDKKKELPHCAWCGSVSTTICGRCKARAYCSTECQKHDWKAGHQTACATAPIRQQPKPTEEKFTFYHISYIAHWAVNLRRWGLQRESREFDYLLSKLPEESQEWITSRTRWPAVKMALARELIIRRLAEVLTQGQWHKVKWKHDREADRDYLDDRTEYVWTGEKYTNANHRFPNFNFCICECGEYLFVVSHPAALTGVHAAAPLKKDPLPDPSEEFASQLQAARLEIDRIDMETNEALNTKDHQAIQHKEGDVLIEEVLDEGDCARSPDDIGETSTQDCSQAEHVSEAESDIGQAMFSASELLAICSAENKEERQSRLRQALVGKIAYFRTLGQQRRRRWNEVVLEHSPVGASCEGGELSPEHSQLHKYSEDVRRHHLYVGGMRQNKWRSEVHDFRGYCIVVNRAPPDEAMDPSGEFSSTMAARFLDIDMHDKLLEHPEPPFIEVPIMQLLPDEWHTDYIRACGRGEKGEQTRINR